MSLLLLPWEGRPINGISSHLSSISHKILKLTLGGAKCDTFLTGYLHGDLTCFLWQLLCLVVFGAPAIQLTGLFSTVNHVWMRDLNKPISSRNAQCWICSASSLTNRFLADLKRLVIQHNCLFLQCTDKSTSIIKRTLIGDTRSAVCKANFKVEES